MRWLRIAAVEDMNSFELLLLPLEIGGARKKAFTTASLSGVHATSSAQSMVVVVLIGSLKRRISFVFTLCCVCGVCR